MITANKVLQAFDLLTRLAAAEVRYCRYLQRYGRAAPPPYEVLWTDPDAIEYCTVPSLMAQLGISRYGSHVVDGCWDRRVKLEEVWYTRGVEQPVVAEFEKHALYRSIADHFENQVPWENTEWYRWVEDNPDVAGQYQDISTMERRLSRVDDLYDYIRSEGYKTQRELREQENPPLHEELLLYPEHYEVDVNICRSGRLFWNFSGRHRLAIAKVLDLDKIPVRVFARHEEWQNHRINAVDGTSEDPQLDHPDIEPLMT